MKYLPDTHGALHADDIVQVLGGPQTASMLQRTEMAMLIWKESLSIRRFQRQGEFI